MKEDLNKITVLFQKTEELDSLTQDELTEFLQGLVFVIDASKKTNLIKPLSVQIKKLYEQGIKIMLKHKKLIDKNIEMMRLTKGILH